MNVLNLFLIFFKYGLLCFGGGYMLIPLLTADFIGDAPWQLSVQELGNLISLAQVTPGPIGLNAATYIGFTRCSFWGGLVASIGIVAPALILVLLAIKLLKKYEKSFWVVGFLAGMRPASFGLILGAGMIFAELSIFSGNIPWFDWSKLVDGSFHIYPLALAMTVVSVWVLRKTKIYFLWILLVCGVLGAIFL